MCNYTLLVLPVLMCSWCRMCEQSDVDSDRLASGPVRGVARPSPLLEHSMGTLRLYELPREVQKLIGRVWGHPPPRNFTASQVGSEAILYRSEVYVTYGKLAYDETHNSVLYIAVLRRSISRPFSARFTINNATISAALVGHGHYWH